MDWKCVHRDGQVPVQCLQFNTRVHNGFEQGRLRINSPPDGLLTLGGSTKTLNLPRDEQREAGGARELRRCTTSYRIVDRVPIHVTFTPLTTQRSAPLYFMLGFKYEATRRIVPDPAACILRNEACKPGGPAPRGNIFNVLLPNGTTSTDC